MGNTMGKTRPGGRLGRSGLRAGGVGAQAPLHQPHQVPEREGEVPEPPEIASGLTLCPKCGAVLPGGAVEPGHGGPGRVATGTLRAT